MLHGCCLTITHSVISLVLNAYPAGPRVCGLADHSRTLNLWGYSMVGRIEQKKSNLFTTQARLKEDLVLRII